MKLNIRQPIISMLNLLCLFSLCILMLNKIALIYLFVFLMCWLMNPCITKANYILSLSLQGKKNIAHSPKHCKTWVLHKTAFNALSVYDYDNFKILKVLDLDFMTKQIWTLKKLLWRPFFSQNNSSKFR